MAVVLPAVGGWLTSMRSLLPTVFLAACGGATASPPIRGTAPPGVCAPVALVPSVSATREPTVQCDEGCRLQVGSTLIDLEDEPYLAEVGSSLDVELDGDAGAELAVWVKEIIAVSPNLDMTRDATRLYVLDDDLTALGSLPWSSEAPEPQSASCTGEGVLADPDCDGVIDTISVVQKCLPDLCQGELSPEDQELVGEACAAGPEEQTHSLQRSADGYVPGASS